MSKLSNEMVKIILMVMLIGFSATAPTAGEVSIYGWLNTFAEVRSESEVQSTYISSNGSRMGLRGAEELSNSMKILWQIESEVILDQSG